MKKISLNKHEINGILDITPEDKKNEVVNAIYIIIKWMNDNNIDKSKCVLITAILYKIIIKMKEINYLYSINNSEILNICEKIIKNAKANFVIPCVIDGVLIDEEAHFANSFVEEYVNELNIDIK